MGAAARVNVLRRLSKLRSRTKVSSPASANEEATKRTHQSVLDIDDGHAGSEQVVDLVWRLLARLADGEGCG